MTSSAVARICLGAVTFTALLVINGCGRSGSDEDTPDEASFCLLATINDPVAEASALVLQRLDELAPAEIDDAVVVLRKGAEEIEENDPGTPERIAAEFEARFRPDHIAARRQVEAFLAESCADDTPRSTMMESQTDGEGTDDSED